MQASSFLKNCLQSSDHEKKIKLDIHTYTCYSVTSMNFQTTYHLKKKDLFITLLSRKKIQENSVKILQNDFFERVTSPIFIK